MRLNRLNSGKFKALKLALLTLCIGLAAQFAFAATTGSISGTVTDTQGAIVSGAHVELRNTLTGVIQSITTDSAGFYNFPSLSLGNYDVTFENAGFEKFVQTNVVIDVDTARRVDAALRPGSVQDQITVVSTEAQVNTENAQLGDVITGTEMAELPIGDRSYTDLLMLQPGT